MTASGSSAGEQSPLPNERAAATAKEPAAGVAGPHDVAAEKGGAPDAAAGPDAASDAGTHADLDQGDGAECRAADDPDHAADDEADDQEDEDARREAAVLAACAHVERLLVLRGITAVIHVDDDHPAHDQPAADPIEVIAALDDGVVTINHLARNDATRSIVTTETGELTTTQALKARIELHRDEVAEADMVALSDAVRMAQRSLAAESAAESAELIAGATTDDGAIDGSAADDTNTDSTSAPDGAATDIVNEPQATDLQVQTEIRRLIPEGVEYRPITLAQWNDEKDGVLDSAEPVLILFDRDFHLEGQADTLGESLLVDAINRHNDNIYCGMLTHGAVSDTTEQDLVSRIADRSGSGDSSVDIIVIAKSTVVEQPGKFPTKLKGVLVSRQLRALRERVQEIFASAGRHAADELGKLDAFTLLELVVAADHEGTHGVHNILRVAATKQRIATHSALWPDSAVNESLSDIRTIHDAEQEDNPLPATDISGLRREDRYDTGDYLAELHLPLEPGDIFEKVSTSVVLNGATPTDPGKRYILLMQPCDIAVRGDGQRLGSPKTFTLALLKPVPEKKVHQYDHVLRWYDPVDEGKVWCVQIWDRVQLPVRALEACVFGDGGRAVVEVGQAPPLTLTPGWRRRYDSLQVWADRKLGVYKQATQSKLDPQIDKLLTESLTGTAEELVDIKAAFDIVGNRIGFGVRRIGRASNDDARLILANAGNYTARPGGEGDLFPPTT